MKVCITVIATLVVVTLIYAVINLILVSRGSNAPVATQVTKSTAPVAPKPTPPTIAELLSLVNAERAKVGVAPLTEDVRLDKSAQRKSDDMLAYNYFGHVSPHDGEHGYQYINDVGISCKTDSENITENTIVNDTQHAVNAWINSKLHYEAMVSSNYTETGFGISGNFIVEHFCQP